MAGGAHCSDYEAYRSRGLAHMHITHHGIHGQGECCIHSADTLRRKHCRLYDGCIGRITPCVLTALRTLRCSGCRNKKRARKRLDGICNPLAVLRGMGGSIYYLSDTLLTAEISMKISKKILETRLHIQYNIRARFKCAVSICHTSEGRGALQTARLKAA